MISDKRFQFELPKNGGVSVCFLGSTRSGKTTFLKYLIDKSFSKHFKILMSNSIHNPIYKELGGVSKDIVKSPIYFPKLVKDGYDINKETKNHYDFLYILDDVVTAKFDKELLKLLAIYRNSNLSCIISIQSPIIRRCEVNGHDVVILRKNRHLSDNIRCSSRRDGCSFIITRKIKLGRRNRLRWRDLIPEIISRI